MQMNTCLDCGHPITTLTGRLCAECADIAETLYPGRAVAREAMLAGREAAS